MADARELENVVGVCLVQEHGPGISLTAYLVTVTLVSCVSDRTSVGREEKEGVEESLPGPDVLPWRCPPDSNREHSRCPGVRLETNAREIVNVLITLLIASSQFDSNVSCAFDINFCGIFYKYIMSHYCLTIWRRCCHMGTAIEHPVPDQVKPSFVIFDILTLWRSTLSHCQSAQIQISKITNDSLTRSGTGCFIAVPIWQQWALNG